MGPAGPRRVTNFSALSTRKRLASALAISALHILVAKKEGGLKSWQCWSRNQLYTDD